jgi:tRNA-2-methylthio-N6-dimethylallyladenosine synthase
LAVLLERQRAIQTARSQALIGKQFEVLVEDASRRAGQWAGRTSSNRVLNFTSSQSDLLGEYIQIRVTSCGATSLAGEHV